MTHYRQWYSILVAVVWVTSVTAQKQGNLLQSDQNTVKLRLAEAYEHAGDYAKALPIYEQLYHTDENNLIVFDALRRTYMQVKRYDEAIAIVTKRLDRAGADIALFGLLGDCYYKAGKETEAFATWSRGITVFNNSATAYRVIANYLIDNRLYDKAIQMLIEGRDQSTERSSITQEIGLLYSLTFRYEDATREYLSIVAEKGLPMLEVIRQRIDSYIAKPEALRTALIVARRETARHEDNVALQMLLAWLYQEAKEYDDALTVYKNIDVLLNAQGREILNFAERIMKEHAFQTAAKGFKEYIDHYPAQAALPQAKYGYARVLEELGTQPDTSGETANTPASRISWLTEAIHSYNVLVSEHPQTQFARLALYRIALIKFNAYFDINGALRALDEIRERYPDSETNPDVAITTGDVHVARGDLDHALSSYRAILRTNVTCGQTQKNLALFKCIQIEYYRGEFDSALTHLAPLAQETTSDIANDAIKLQMFIQYHRRNQDEALKVYAHAELLSRQHKYTEAIAMLEDVIKRFPSSLLLDDALIHIGDLYRSADQFIHALDSYQRLVKEYPESIFADQALFTTAEIYSNEMHEKEKSIATYESLLERFPNSLLAGEARKRIRILRGDTL